MVLTALASEGGVDYLRLQARERPEVFARLLAKCMPQAIELETQKDVTVTLDFSGGRRRDKNYDLINEPLALPEPERSN